MKQKIEGIKGAVKDTKSKGISFSDGYSKRKAQKKNINKNKQKEIARLRSIPELLARLDKLEAEVEALKKGNKP